MKKNKKKKKLNIIKLLVFILIFYIIIYSIYSLLNMKIRNIVIKGNTYLKDYEIIEQYVDGTDGTGMGHLGTQEVGVTIPDMNQVNSASKKIKEVLNNK